MTHTHEWRGEYIDLASWRLKSLQIEILEKGPKSLAQSWIMQAMYNDWKRKKGIKDPEPPDCQSSLSEFYKKQDSYESGNTSGKVEE